MLTRTEALAAAARARQFPPGLGARWLLPAPDDAVTRDIDTMSSIAVKLQADPALAETRG